MRFIVLHLPHLIPALLALGLMVRYWRSIVYGEEPGTEAPAAARPSPPAVDVDARRVRRSTARTGLIALLPLLGAAATGIALYAIALDGRRPSATLVWWHTGLSVVGLVLVAWKVLELGGARLRRGLEGRRAVREGASLLLAALGVPLLLSGALLLARPSSGSVAAYAHLIAAAWWTALLGAHLARYLTRSLAASLQPPAPVAPPPAAPDARSL